MNENTQIVMLDLPASLTHNYKTVKDLQVEILRQFIMAEYQKGHVSIREAAEILSLSYREFMVLLGQHSLSFINHGDEDLNVHFKQFQDFLAQ